MGWYEDILKDKRRFKPLHETYSYDLDTPAFGYETEYGLYTPPISDTYIEQIANALARENKVKIESSDAWSLNLKTRTLSYNPETLKSGTRSNVMCSLLHEIGHLRYSSDYDILQSSWIKKYPNSVKKVINCFEDFRIDKLMETSYSGAEGIYKFNQLAMENEGTNMIAKAHENRRNLISALESLAIDPKHKDKIEQIQKAIEEVKKPTLLEYIGAICIRGANMKMFGKIDPEIDRLSKETLFVVKLGKKARNSQGVLDELDTHVFPRIEELLKENETREKLKEVLGQELVSHLKHLLIPENIQTSRTQEPEYTPFRRFSNYEQIRIAVIEETKKLVRLINRIRNMEDGITETPKQRNGKIDIRRLYKFRLDESKIFSKRLTQQRILNSIAFTLAIDRSGSMSDGSQTEAIKCVVMLTEVAKLCRIPIEVLFYNTNPFLVKTHKQLLNKRIKNKIVSLGQSVSGGTSVSCVYQKIGLANLGKRNKFMFILTDGQEDPVHAQKMTSEFCKKHRITPYFLGIGCQTDCYIPPPFSTKVDTLSNLVGELSKAIKLVVTGKLKFK